MVGRAPRLVLASASPRRRELAAALGLPFTVAPTHVDESSDECDPTRLAESLAVRKAAAGAEAHPGALVIGSDTVVAVDGSTLGKPADTAEARAMLALLRDRDHLVATGVAIAGDGLVRSACTVSRVTMRAYHDAEVEAFIASGAPFDKAGGYAIQDEAFHPVARLDGCACAVMGLPLWSLHRLLTDAGCAPHAPDLTRCAACPDRQGTP